eukprot:gb/GFBE01002171.1/.p1 GENE.gb/GFBE01002171.1/~~gb/GFBE01002171.1/.p1  ORF type:complete len:134 (+),score=16.52 gb/GFBE01002171.1/:1-402(+)
MLLVLLRHLHHFHREFHNRALAYFICFIEGLLVPCAAIVVGGMFLCTATNYCDLFMKSVVFKFISNIDNWIVAINSRTNMLAGTVVPLTVYLPHDRGFAKLLNYIFCVIPIFPICVVSVLASVGHAIRLGMMN